GLGELALHGERLHAPALRAHGDLHEALPTLRYSGRLRELGPERALRAPALRHRLDPRAHADLVEHPAAPGLSDGRDPHLRRTAGPGRGPVACRADVRPRRADNAGARRGRAAAAATAPADRGGQ